MAESVVWMKLTVRAPRPVLLALGSLLIEWGAGGVIDGEGDVAAYFAPSAREDLDAKLRRYAADLGQPVRWVWEEDVGEVWREGWRKHFHAGVVSRRLGVCPTWEAWSPGDPHVRLIRMDPGQAFGTGTHETTRLCLRLIDDALGRDPVSSFLDIGCGSGILSIAARLLGVPRVTAVDLDPAATSATVENAKANGVRKGLTVVRGDLRAVRAAYPLVAANILFQVVLGLGPVIRGRVAGGGRLVLSGMLAVELGAAEAAFRRLGMAVDRVEREGEWGALLLTDRG